MKRKKNINKDEDTKVDMADLMECPDCNGNGYVNGYNDKCLDCKGKGHFELSKMSSKHKGSVISCWKCCGNKTMYELGWLGREEVNCNACDGKGYATTECNLISYKQRYKLAKQQDCLYHWI